MRYPVKIEQDESGFMVTFRDIPEALTCGDTHQHAVNMASDALITAMDFYFEDNRKVPAPSEAVKGELLVDIPAGLQAKISLLNEMIDRSCEIETSGH